MNPISPSYYRSHPSGVECITVSEWFSSNLGQTIQYIWRHAEKNGVEDLRKAAWFLNREIERLSKEVRNHE